MTGVIHYLDDFLL